MGANRLFGILSIQSSSIEKGWANNYNEYCSQDVTLWDDYQNRSVWWTLAKHPTERIANGRKRVNAKSEEQEQEKCYENATINH